LKAFFDHGLPLRPWKADFDGHRKNLGFAFHRVAFWQHTVKDSLAFPGKLLADLLVMCTPTFQFLLFRFDGTFEIG
jgi:hypothetical protein